MDSIFTQPADRTTSLTFFLASIVPLMALSALVAAGSQAQVAHLEVYWPGMQLSIALLSLGSFFAMKRSLGFSVNPTSRQEGGRDDSTSRQSHRLAQLRDRTRLLSQCKNDAEIAGLTTEAAVELAGGAAAMILWRSKDHAGLKLLGMSGPVEMLGDAALMSRLRCGTLGALAGERSLQIREGQPAADGTTWESPSACFIPIANRLGSGGLILMQEEEDSELSCAEIEALEMLAAVAAVRVGAEA